MGDSVSHLERAESTIQCDTDGESCNDGSQGDNQSTRTVGWICRRTIQLLGIVSRDRSLLHFIPDLTIDFTKRASPSKPQPDSTAAVAPSRSDEQVPNTAPNTQPACGSAAATTPDNPSRDCSITTSDTRLPPCNAITTAPNTAEEELRRLVMEPTTSSRNIIEGLLPGLKEEVTRAFIAGMEPGRLIRLDWSKSRMFEMGVLAWRIGPKVFFHSARKVQAQEKVAIEYWNRQGVKFHGWSINEDWIWHFEACLKSGCERCVEEVLSAPHRQGTDANSEPVENGVATERPLISFDCDTEDDEELEESNGDSSEETVEPARQEVLLGIDNYLSNEVTYE